VSKVYLIGAGPGDPELLTVKAARVLGQADVVLYDRLVGPETLLLAKPGAELVYVGKREGEQEGTQRAIFELMLSFAHADKMVARLKGGDAFVFGRGGEEWLYLARHGVEVEAIPGVSSALAAPALAGVPLTCRGMAHGFAVVTGHACDAIRWEDYACVDTLVVLMGVNERARIAGELIRAGRSPVEPAIFIERSSTPEERAVEATLGEVASGAIEVESPAVFVTGAVVALRSELIAALREEAAA
jgi:uroporphyrin-III C-methyltransferase